jgi:predicted nucleic acid-binding protein
MIVLLDSGPLGLATHPRANAEALACQAWLRSLVAERHLVLVPEIIDYEHRRELLLRNALNALARLDAYRANDAFLPVSEAAYLRAAEFWADARRRGIPTADKLALDIDMILCAQAATLDPADFGRGTDRQTGVAAETIIVATTNVTHLTPFVDARHWQAV